ncbi:alpha/beta fold hydrolase [Legionella anisa]|uniref:PHA synthase n=1 Tax=Legionella anisa TaxID=28082 RepID=A0AAX0WRR0_9GAMM|nr:alpha/beta fold hydrolase [Legionella anisa]AWN74808.1 PHA synthase [Legionella anisa]KTC77613.1 PHA synthase [Legionella anisa]MBN5936417.1 polyhydroxyalkanoic acid synthase [Legionella anisa]MCW8425061.1 alpha/beta fold hydrolase [Legionella anisa]MCW8445823.1 alpha/beta fold hydrolase [Legionella anisa]
MKKMAKVVLKEKKLSQKIKAKSGQTHTNHKENNSSVPYDLFNLIDKYYQANLGKFTASISPASVATSFFSWGAQLAQAPGTFLKLNAYPLLHCFDFIERLINQEKPGNGKDVRFHTEKWALYPWRLWAEQFLQIEEWYLNAANEIPGLNEPNRRIVSFTIKQLLDAISPSNFVLTNPDLLQETLNSSGENLIRGTQLGLQDLIEKLTGTPPAGVEHFIPGKQVALTKGKVVFKNHLIELIQYEAQTPKVYKEPILIIPAWIMKYYILDLLPENSLVNWLVQQGHTVFIVSWLNPTSEDRNLAIDDYYRQGAMAAIDKISTLMPNTKIHLMGYCIGGTLAMITAATMAKDHDHRLKSLSLLAAQGDFTEAGELLLFINNSQVSFLENIMWEKGYLDTKLMAGSFQMLRSYDLIWSKMVQDYMHGTQRGMIALLAWNADTTRMPHKMHSEYLEKLFLKNEFSEGQYTIEGKHIAPENIRLPAFVVSTEKDHVSPWKSVYKTHLLIKHEDITFVLTNGGHNAGIVSEPGHPGRSYLIRKQSKEETYISPQHWLEIAETKKGSWWIAWHNWLVRQSTHGMSLPPKIDKNLPDAPGTYVLQK